jgi:hypothetical protein
MVRFEGAMYPDCALPGEDVGNPSVIPFFDFDADLDCVDDERSWAAGETPRRLAGSRRNPAPVRRAAARDNQKPQEPKIEIVLYTSPESEKSRRAMRAVEKVLKRYNAAQVRFTTCDLSQRPQDGEADSVVFTPTLVKQGPGPRTAIIGNLEREEILCDLLDASGVDRRWDD